MSRQNRSGCGCLPLLGTVIILAAGGTGVYFYLRGNLPGQDFTPLKAATVIPQSAFASSYVSTNPKDWSKLEKFGTEKAKNTFSQNFQEWKQDLSENQQIDLEKDVFSWLGGLSFAFVPSKTNPNDSHILIVAGIKDKIKALNFAKKMQNLPNQSLKETEYQGITITEVTTKDYQTFASTVIGNYLVMAENTSVVEQAIDTFKGQPSYAQKEGVKQLLQQKMSLNTPLIRFYVDDYSQLIQQSTPRHLPTPNLEQIQTVDSMVVGIGVENEGIHLQAVANLAPDDPTHSFKPLNNNTLSQYPSETFMLVQGQGIKQGWTEIVKQGQSEPELGNIISEIRQSLRQANLDADKEVFGWMDGQFSLGLLSLPQGGVANFGVGGMIVLETSDRNTGEKSLSKLNQMARFMPFISIDQRKAQGIDLTEWSMPQQGVMVSYGWLNKKEMVLTIGTSYETVNQQSKKGNLSKSPQYKSLITGLPNQPLGSFYLDVEQMMTTINQLPTNNLSPDAQAMLDSIKGIGMTTTLPDKTTSQADVMITLKSQP